MTEDGRVYHTVGGSVFETRGFGKTGDGGPVIVFLHEGLGSARLWRDYPARVASAVGLSAVAVSRLGYGDSDPCPLPRPVDYMEREAESTLPALLAAMGLEEFILYGHSDGGSIALLYAAGDPSQGLKAVVTEAAHVFCEELTLSSIRAARTAFDGGSLRDKLKKHHTSVDHAFNGWCGMWLDPDFAAWNFSHLLGRIRVPVLALQGDSDEYGTMSQLRTIEDLARARIAVIADCGHAPHREKPDEALGHVVPFLKGVLRGDIK